MTDQKLLLWRDNLLSRYRQENPSFSLLRVPMLSDTGVISDANARIEPNQMKAKQSNHQAATVETRLYLLFAD